MGHPTIYPTGATVYNPEKAWSGYTIFQAYGKGAMLIDMNGREIRLWKGLEGFPNKIFPGGYVLGSHGQRSGKFGMQDQVDLVQLDWDGNEVWKFDHLQYIEDPGETPRFMARQHHDYQREGSPTGYYAPGLEPNATGGNTLILCHKNIVNKEISDKVLLEDVFVEVDWEGNILWQWSPNEHFDELGFDEQAKNVLFRDPNMRSAGGGMGDWLHINSMSKIGPNKWYDAGDVRFHPENIIWDSRESNIIAITSKETGKIVWKIGPDYNTPETRHLGWIIGQHHAHIIPKGLPGEGNILVFDNGGWAGYGYPNPGSQFGLKAALRDHSRVLEINPVTLQIVWKYTAEEAGYGFPYDSSRFYSPYISSAQRLPNGNTLIVQGSDGRLFEVTAEHEIVWEYISPYRATEPKINNMVYRAYRVPYEWVPQAGVPEEIEIAPIDVTTFRIPGAAPLGGAVEIEVEGVIARRDTENAFCVAAKEEAVQTAPLFTVKSDSIEVLDDSTLEEFLTNSKEATLTVFGAPRCGKCKITMEMLKFILKQGDALSVRIGYFDVDAYPAAAQAHDVTAIPTLLLNRGGHVVERIVGAISSDRLETLLKE